jgi:hypothetical protein
MDFHPVAVEEHDDIQENHNVAESIDRTMPAKVKYNVEDYT